MPQQTHAGSVKKERKISCDCDNPKKKTMLMSHAKNTDLLKEIFFFSA